MRATNIQWDVTDDSEEMTQEKINELLEYLPTEIEIPEDIDSDDEEAISDYISNSTGFCHNGYCLEKDYFFKVSFCHGQNAIGDYMVTAENEEAATDKALREICDKLYSVLPELSIDVTVELIEDNV